MIIDRRIATQNRLQMEVVLMILMRLLTNLIIYESTGFQLIYDGLRRIEDYS